jgi:elongator complex protein 3
LHVFGPQVPLSEQCENAAQHKGLGRALLKKAEEIAFDEFQTDRMVILSGVGAREYYRSDFGYSLEGNYMVKNLKNRD